MESVFKALADPTRRGVLELLKDGPMTASELAERFVVSRPTMSAHFAVLRDAGLVHAQKDGKRIIYHLQLSVLEEALLGFAGKFDLAPKRGSRAAGMPATPKKS